MHLNDTPLFVFLTNSMEDLIVIRLLMKFSVIYGADGALSYS
jgi:hypothetical protein